MKRGIFILIFSLFAACTLRAQIAIDSMRIYYPQGYRYIVPTLRNNSSELEHFIKSASKALQEGQLDKVVIKSYASPDGTDKANKALAIYRADELASYLKQHAGLPDRVVEKHSEGIAWGLLGEMVQASDMKYKDEVLHILEHTPVWVFDQQGRVVDGRKKQLMDLHGGVPYNYMYKEFFPDLRSSIAAVLYVRQEVPEVAEETIPAEPEQAEPPAQTAQPEQPAEPVQPEPSVTPEAKPKPFRPIIAVKTNLLYWATVMPDFHSYTFVPNLEIEWFFKDRWSLAGTGNYAKWGHGDNEYFGISSWSIEPRWWCKGDGQYRWLYIGAYGQVGDYDVQNDRVDRDGNTGNLWGAGLSVGAVIPFSKRWGLEIGIRGGYRHGEVRAYSYEAPAYFFDYEATDNHWGITGIKASLYFRFGKSSK